MILLFVQYKLVLFVKITKYSNLNVLQTQIADLTIDQLWMSVFSCLGELCVDYRPAVRKSAGQTLFSMLTTHGTLLRAETWPDILWKVGDFTFCPHPLTLNKFNFNPCSSTALHP